VAVPVGATLTTATVFALIAAKAVWQPGVRLGQAVPLALNGSIPAGIERPHFAGLFGAGE